MGIQRGREECREEEVGTGIWIGEDMGVQRGQKGYEEVEVDSVEVNKEWQRRKVLEALFWG